MSLTNEAEIKISKIHSETGLLGYYQFDNKKEAISIINLYHRDCMNDNGNFKKNKIDANCGPIYQALSAAIDYYKFEKGRSPPPPIKKKEKKEKKEKKGKNLTPSAIQDLDSMINFDEF